MNIIRLSFAILSLACITYGATNETFEITSYFPGNGEVGIKSGAGGRTNRPFSSFSEAEQQQITAWLADKEFQNGGLSVEITEKKTTNSKGLGNLIGQIEDVSYAVSLENRSEAGFSDVQIESRMFYKTKVGDVETQYCSVKLDRLSLSAEESRTVETTSLQLRDGRTRSTQAMDAFGTTVTLSGVPGGPSFTTGGSSMKSESADWKYTPPTQYKDRFLGMYLCVSRKDRNGNIIKQEFEEGRVPDKKDWADYQRQSEARGAQPNSVSETRSSRKKQKPPQ